MPLLRLRRLSLALFLATMATAAEPAGPEPAKLSPDALAKLEASAQAGSTDAQLELALAYDEGRTGKSDPVRAAEWYQRAAAQNLGVAHLRLGMMAESGVGLPQSYLAARESYERAIALGVVEANLRLGVLHIEGWGVKRDSAAALGYIEKAAEGGYKPAQTILADMYMTGIGVKRDRAQAVAWAERAARQKDPEGEMRLAVWSFKQGKLPQDVQLSREWFQLSAAQEYSSAMLGMASTFFRGGNQSAEDIALGKRWLEFAVDSGNSAAAFYLAAVLTGEISGDVLPADTEQRVRTLLERSLQGGEKTADETLELVKSGRSFRAAFRQVLEVPFTQRYVDRYAKQREAAARNPTADRQPLVERLVRPTYPAALRVTHQTGEVIVDFVVDTTGRVRNAFVVKSSHEAFSARALVAVRQWVFMPGVRQGRIVNTHMQVPIHFAFSEISEGGKKTVESVPTPNVDSLKK